MPVYYNIMIPLFVSQSTFYIWEFVHFNNLSFFRVRVMVVVGVSSFVCFVWHCLQKQNKRKFIVCLLEVEFHCACRTDLHKVRSIYQFHFWFWLLGNIHHLHVYPNSEGFARGNFCQYESQLFPTLLLKAHYFINFQARKTAFP